MPWVSTASTRNVVSVFTSPSEGSVASPTAAFVTVTTFEATVAVNAESASIAVWMAAATTVLAAPVATVTLIAL